MRHKLIFLLVMLVALTLFAFACDEGEEEGTPTGETPSAETPTSEPSQPTPTAVESPVSSEPIKILLVHSLSGNRGVFGQAYKTVAEIVVDQWNESGGILGRPVELTVDDDGSDPEQGVSLIQRHLSEDDFDWVLPGFSLQPAGPVLKDADIMISSIDQASPLADQENFPHYFSPSNLTSTVARAMALYASEGISAEKVAVLYATDFLGENFWAEFEPIAADHGLEIVASESFSPEQVDTTPQLIKLRDANPDVLVLSSLPPHVGTALKDRVKLGWDIPVVGDNLVSAGALGPLVGEENLDGVTVLAYKLGALASDGEIRPELVDFVEQVKADLGGPPPIPFTTYGLVYNTLQFIKLGFEGAQSTDAEEVTSYLENLDYPPSPDPFIGPVEVTPEVHIGDTVDAFVIAEAAELTDGFYPYYADIPSE